MTIANKLLCVGHRAESALSGLGCCQVHSLGVSFMEIIGWFETGHHVC